MGQDETHNTNAPFDPDPTQSRFAVLDGFGENISDLEAMVAQIKSQIHALAGPNQRSVGGSTHARSRKAPRPTGRAHGQKRA